jgi:hypothetical protein
MSADEIVRAEKAEIERLIALGLGRYDAVQAVDWQTPAAEAPGPAAVALEPGR